MFQIGLYVRCNKQFDDVVMDIFTMFTMKKQPGAAAPHACAVSFTLSGVAHQ